MNIELQEYFTKEISGFLKAMGHPCKEIRSLEIEKTKKDGTYNYTLFQIETESSSQQVLMVIDRGSRIFCLPSDEILQDIFECTSSPPSIPLDTESPDKATP